MDDKELYSKVNISIQPLEIDEKIDVLLEYYLTEKIYKVDEESREELRTFGVEVVKREYLKDTVVKVESNSADHLFVEKFKIKQLIDDLSKNTVTPVGLYDVLDSLIGISY